MQVFVLWLKVNLERDRHIFGIANYLGNLQSAAYKCISINTEWVAQLCLEHKPNLDNQLGFG